MTRDELAAIDRSAMARVVVDYTTGQAGPTLVVFAALHGDEPGGVRALERVRGALEETEVPIAGKLVGVVGNVAAVERGVRYVERDLNRRWYEDEIDNLRRRKPERDTSEDREQRQILAVLATLEDEPNQPVVFLDLHSTSAPGPPFSCMPDTLSNLKIAMELPIPAILNLEETIDGPLLGYLSDRGYGGVIVEGGQHRAERTAGVLESAIWVMLAAVGCVSRDDVPHFQAHRNRLAALGSGLPRVLEITYRHDTRPDDGFEMEPGFTHYDRVRKGQLLARDRAGAIRAPRRGRIIMPRYQDLSDQGFFIARDVPTLYIKVLFLIRWLRLAHLVHWLPGARRDPRTPRYIHVARWIPNWLVNVIRLLGWRRTYRDAERTILRKRRVRKPLRRE